MGESFYRPLNEFRSKYPGKAEKERALRTMGAEEIMQLARACATVQEACWYAQYAEMAKEGFAP